MTRLENARRAEELRKSGMPRKQVAAELGLSLGYVNALLSDPVGVGDRMRKMAQRRPCVDCGETVIVGVTRRGRDPRCNRCVLALLPYIADAGPRPLPQCRCRSALVDDGSCVYCGRTVMHA